MTSDRYLKAVLTVIAACLVYLCLVSTPWPVASAAAPALEPTEVVIVGYKDGRYSSQKYVPLPVVIKESR
jgi:hypothetical protein